LYEASIIRRHARLAPRLKIKVDFSKIFEKPLNQGLFLLFQALTVAKLKFSENLNYEKQFMKVAKPDLI